MPRRRRFGRFLRTIVERETGRLLGAHVIGAGADEQLNLFTLAMKGGLKAGRSCPHYWIS